MNERDDLEAKLGHRFTDRALLEQALTHGSVRHEQQTGEASTLHPIEAPIEDNERLEFLGDAIVGMVVGELLYRRYPELDEGALTRLRAALVSRKHLGLVGTGLGLGSYLRLGRAEERNGGRRKPVLLANCMEALIGALYLEGSLPAAAAFVERTVVTPYLDDLRDELRENRAIGDYKTALQELLQARRAGQPEYVVEAESGPDHRKRFVVEVRVSTGQGSSAEPIHKAQAEGSTKKKAAQEAARRLYERLSGRSHGQLAAAPEYGPADPVSQALRETFRGSEASPEPLPSGLPEGLPEMGLQFDSSTIEAGASREQQHPIPADRLPGAKTQKRRRSAPNALQAWPSDADRQPGEANGEKNVRMAGAAAREPDGPRLEKDGVPGAVRPKPERAGRRLTGESPR